MKEIDLSNKYTKEFYDEHWLGSYKKAKMVLPVVLNLLPKINSVVDFGCGTGVWLSVFQELGINDITGYDGPWVNKESLRIPFENFNAVALDKKICLKKRYDLAISIEVAEHLPKESAKIFVETLTAASDIVLFSAAIPNQGGENHINEQWQDYWVKIFKENNYIGTDIVRKNIWKLWSEQEIQGGGVSKQNIILFINKRIINDINSEFIKEEESIIWDIVHPETFLWKINNLQTGSSIYDISLLNLYKICFKRTIKKIIGKRVYQKIKKLFYKK